VESDGNHLRVSGYRRRCAHRRVNCHARKRAATHFKLESDEIENWHHLTWKHSSHGLQVHMREAGFVRIAE
jgi:hypothetical protein